MTKIDNSQPYIEENTSDLDFFSQKEISIR